MNDRYFLLELSKVEGKLMSYAMHLTQGREDDAQELFQSTVVRAYIKRNLFAPDSCFLFWIERIMRNIYLNECIAAQRRNVLNTGCYDESDGNASSSSHSDIRLEFNEVCTIIESLPYDIALPLRMYASGYKYCEIANRLNIPLSCVKNRIRAARIYLKRLCQE